MTAGEAEAAVSPGAAVATGSWQVQANASAGTKAVGAQVTAASVASVGSPAVQADDQVHSIVTSYSEFRSAIDNLTSGTIHAVGTITDEYEKEEYADGWDITIGSGKDITIVGSEPIANDALAGANSTPQSFIRLTRGRFVVDGGSLTLCDGTEENAVALVDARNSSRQAALVQVKNGGTLTVKDGVTIGPADGQGLSSFNAIEVGTSVSGDGKTETPSKLVGEGGKVTGGTVKLNAGNEASFSGGTYLNDNDALVVAAGARVTSISGGTFGSAKWRGVAINYSQTNEGRVNGRGASMPSRAARSTARRAASACTARSAASPAAPSTAAAPQSAASWTRAR